MTGIKVKCYVIVPCKLDKDGKVAMSATSRAPYGYHHIYKVYDDKSFWLSATVDSSVGIGKLHDIARLIAGDLPVRIDAEFR
jgi:hypothetical protein